MIVATSDGKIKPKVLSSKDLGIARRAACGVSHCHHWVYDQYPSFDIPYKELRYVIPNCALQDL